MMGLFDDWEFERFVGITNPNSEDLTNYQVRIVLNSDNVPNFDWVVDKDSIRFSDSNNSPLYYWIETYDSTNEQAVVWVKIPSLPASSDKTIHLYYHNPQLSDYKGVYDGLVAWYKLNGDAVDSSGNGYDGTVAGATATTNRFSQDDKALSFNGSSDYVSVPKQAIQNISSSMSVSAWVYLNSTSGSYNRIIDFDYDDSNGFALYKGSNNGNINFGIGTGTKQSSGYSTTDITSGWHLIIGVYDGSKCKLFVDGVLESENSCSGNVNVDVLSGSIGSKYSHDAEYWNGKIGDVRIYNRALSQVEIEELYHSSNYYSGDEVFELFDDFNSGIIDVNKWDVLVNSGSITINNGVLDIVRDGNGTNNIQAKTGFSEDYVVSIKSTLVSINSGHNVGLGIMDGDESDTTGFWAFYTSGGVFNLYERSGGGWTKLQGSVGSYTTNVFDKLSIIKSGDNFTFLKNDSQVGGTQTISVGSTTYVIMPRVWNESPGEVGHLKIDWVFVRKHASQEPTTEVYLGTSLTDTTSFNDNNLTTEGTFKYYEFQVLNDNNKRTNGVIISWGGDLNNWLVNNDFTIRVSDGISWYDVNNNDKVLFDDYTSKVIVRFVSNTGFSGGNVDYDWFKVKFLK